MSRSALGTLHTCHPVLAFAVLPDSRRRRTGATTPRSCRQQHQWRLCRSPRPHTRSQLHQWSIGRCHRNGGCMSAPSRPRADCVAQIQGGTGRSLRLWSYWVVCDQRRSLARTELCATQHCPPPPRCLRSCREETRVIHGKSERLAALCVAPRRS